MAMTASPRVVGFGGVRLIQGHASGVAAGFFAALIWAIYLIFAKQGTADGLMPRDFALLRFGTATVVLLPWFLRHDPLRLGGVGWRRAAVLTVLAGPPFILLSTGAYRYAPLAHGAVIQPSTVTLGSMLAAALLLKERLTRDKLIGVALIVAGLAVIASHARAMGGNMVWIGDLFFVGAGLSWAAFTVLLKRWNLEGTAVTTAVSVFSALIVVPWSVFHGDFGRLAALPTSILITQILVQGVLSGVLALIAFSFAVRRLGAAKAGLFPAVVPVATLILSVPVAGAMPGPIDMLGAVLATLGLATAIGLVRSFLLHPRSIKG